MLHVKQHATSGKDNWSVRIYDAELLRWLLSVMVDVLRRDEKCSTKTALGVQRRNLMSKSKSSMVRWSFMHPSVECVAWRTTLVGGRLWKGFTRMIWTMPRNIFSAMCAQQNHHQRQTLWWWSGTRTRCILLASVRTLWHYTVKYEPEVHEVHYISFRDGWEIKQKRCHLLSVVTLNNNC